MEDRQLKLKLSWINIFNLSGALYGWHQSHSWEGAAWGFAVGTVGPPLFILCCFLGAFAAVKLVDNWPMPKVRISDDISTSTEDPEKRWEQEYAKHCLDNNLPNELRTCVKQDLYYAEAESISRTTSGGGPG